MRKYKTLTLLITLFLSINCACASNLCSANCAFNVFFKENYQRLISYLNPDCEQQRLFDILFNAYSIKFEGLDYEYAENCKKLKEDTNSDEISRHCINEQKKYLKNLAEIAEEEYDSFLDDLSFELCGCENSEHKIIKKNKKKYRKNLKKYIAKNCK